MSANKQWDLTSQSSFSGGLDWVRKRGGALVVLAIRPQDVCFAVAPNLEPMEAITLLRNELPALLQKLIDDRVAKAGKKTTGRARPERNLDAEEC